MNQGSQEIIRNLNDSLTGEVAFKRVTKVYKGIYRYNDEYAKL